MRETEKNKLKEVAAQMGLFIDISMSVRRVFGGRKSFFFPSSYQIEAGLFTHYVNAFKKKPKRRKNCSLNLMRLKTCFFRKKFLFFYECKNFLKISLTNFMIEAKRDFLDVHDFNFFQACNILITFFCFLP